MDLKETVGQQLMIGISGISIDAETERHLRDIKPGFIILFARNISSAGQVQELVARLKQLVSPPPLIAVDQEGGRVIRFARDVTVFPGNMALGAADSVELAFNQGFTSAMQLKALGIDINLAPVVDVLTVTDNPAITTRSFGDNPERVSELALAFSRGTRLAGVAAVAKHFPGMGAARVDPHLDLPAVSLSEDTFESIHRLPFKKLMADGINGIMSTHLCCTGLDNDGTIPATFSTAIVADYIRKRCGYDGLIFSDDLEMGAIARHHRIGDACLGALEAGHDVLLICREYGRQASGFEAVLHACERSAEAQARLAESLRRIAALRQFCATPPFANRQLPAIAPGELAETIARDSVTVISAGTVPLPVDAGDTSEIHLIIPDLSSMPLLEDGYELSERHPIISACRACFPGRCTFQFFPMNPRPADVERIAATAAGHRDCILFLSDALGNPGQRDLIAKIRERCRHPLFILLDNPFDHALIAPDETCLTAYGSRKVQIQALAKVMFGKAAAPGKLPFRTPA
jgi:beta-N-acetylhexosaminidase